MNKQEIINILTKGTVFYGKVPDLLSDYDYDYDAEGNKRYSLNCGMYNAYVPLNTSIYFYKSPFNNKYIMSHIPDKQLEVILYHHEDIDEMIDFDEIDFQKLQTTTIDQLPKINRIIDAHRFVDIEEKEEV